MRTPDEEVDRLSGEEFVASVRYSPPEFVWRDELRNDREAWQSITFYQIGATLHDMIMRHPIFKGHDTPRAKLYEAVKHVTPEIRADDCEPWLVSLARSCLVKGWRDRRKLVAWDNFSGPTASSDTTALVQSLRLKQIQAAQLRVQQEEERIPAPKATRAQELWALQDGVFLEVRQYLMTVGAFPKFGATHEQHADGYTLNFRFECDKDLLFDQELAVKIRISSLKDFEAATKLEVLAQAADQEVFSGSWTEMFTVEKMAELCQRAMIEAAMKLLKA